MKTTNMLRIATADTAGAVDSACSEVEMAVGLPVRPELQEIENGCLILELRLGDANVHTPSPSRLALTVDKSTTDVEVLSAWTEPSPWIHSQAAAIPSSSLRTIRWHRLHIGR